MRSPLTKIHENILISSIFSSKLIPSIHTHLHSIRFRLQQQWRIVEIIVVSYCLVSYYKCFALPSPHPRSTVISRIVQSFTGVGKEFFAAVHQRLECAAGTARITRHPSTALVCGIINAFRRYCQQFFAVGKKVYERSARRAGIACHPRASAVCGILNTFGTNAKHFASVSNHLWHNTFSFNLFIKFQKLFSLSNLQKNVFLLRIKSFFVDEFVYFYQCLHGNGRNLD